MAFAHICCAQPFASHDSCERQKVKSDQSIASHVSLENISHASDEQCLIFEGKQPEVEPQKKATLHCTEFWQGVSVTIPSLTSIGAQGFVVSSDVDANTHMPIVDFVEGYLAGDVSMAISSNAFVANSVADWNADFVEGLSGNCASFIVGDERCWNQMCVGEDVDSRAVSIADVHVTVDATSLNAC